MRRLAQVAVVAVLARVERADGDRRCLRAPASLAARRRARWSPLREDADQHEVVGAAVALHDLVRDARERPPDLVGVHDRRLEAGPG